MSAASGQSSPDEWIEILEPKTRVQMFANVRTGECRWDEPRGQRVSRAADPQRTQWWELFDTNSQRFYYYCAKDSKTVWKRPQSADAVVVPLAKLQILKQTAAPTAQSVATQTEPQLCSRATQTSTQTNDYSFDNSFQNPSLKHYLISEARLTHAMRIGGQELDFDSDDDNLDDVLDSSDVSCDADDEYDCDYSDDDSDDDNDRPDGRPYEGRRVVDDDDDYYDNVTLDDHIRRRPDRPSVKLRPQWTDVLAAAAQPLTSPEAQSSAPTKSHSLTQISSNVNRNCVQNKRLTTTLTTPTTTSTTPAVAQTLQSRPQTPPKSRQISQTLSLLPRDQTSAKSGADSTALSIESFAKENIERHRKRGIFIGKKVSLKAMLEWSKKSIRKPMISSISDHKLRHESKVMFKCVQRFMRDDATSEPTTAVDDTDVALQLLTTATQQPILRDELLVQIARQTTNNPSADSEARGLRLMCACFWYFPPSHKLAPHLAAFLAKHANAYARQVVRRKFEQQLRRSQQSHVVYVRRPHDRREVARVLRCVQNGFVGVFGESLDDALVDGRLIPWPIVLLTESLLRSGSGEDGEREGVFRCVGDLDDVMRLKIKIDTVITGHDVDDRIDDVDVNPDDIHVTASALKLYFRELKRPLVPHDVYWEALDAAHDAARAQRLVAALPTVHRMALAYLVRFLQVFSAPEHVQRTKMDDANLSMVWAPNILRAAETAPDTSLANIFERTRAEMSFVRTLIQNLDTTFIHGVQ